MKPTREESLPFHRILVATDFGESSGRAIALAAKLSRAADAQLTLVHTVERPGYVYGDTGYPSMALFTAVSDAAKKQLNEEVRALRHGGISVEGVLREGVAWEGILSAAEATKADLIVVGTHGHRGLTHVLLGSVAEKVVQKSIIPVLTVRGGTVDADVRAGHAQTSPESQASAH